MLAPEWIEWVGQDGKDMEGFTPRIRPLPDNGYAAAKGGAQPVQPARIARADPASKLDDEIPF